MYKSLTELEVNIIVLQLYPSYSLYMKVIQLHPERSLFHIVVWGDTCDENDRF
jgi:hypothetical protein